MPGSAKRNPLFTVKGTRYTYSGWVRAYNAALRSGIPNLAYRLADAYPAHYNKHMEQARKNDLGTRQHKPSPGIPAKPKPARKTTAHKSPAKPTEKEYESVTAGGRRSRNSPYHTPPQYIEHWEAAVSQAKGNMARPSIQLPQLKGDLKHFQRLAKEHPDNDYYPVAITSTRRQIASSLDRIRAEQDQLRYLAKHKPTVYLDKARYMREKRARERRHK